MSKAIARDEGERTVRLRVICTPMPPAAFGRMEKIELVMQYAQEVRPGVATGEGAMRFECEVRVKRNPKTERPNFLGPWVHGTPDARFLYLNWQGWEAGEQQEFRRMKVHLSSITWEQIEEVSQNPEAVLEATVSGIDRNGGPACASVPLLDDGWIVREG